MNAKNPTAGPTGSPSISLLPSLLLGAFVLALTLWAYLPGMKAGFYFDDLPNVVEAPALHWTGFSLEGVRQVIEEARLTNRVIANLSFALNHLYGELQPAPYHWTNLVIHLVVGVVLAWVSVLLASTQPRRAVSAGTLWLCAVAATALFLLHPLSIQSVTYVVQRMTSLAALFSLLAFGCYLSARRSSGKGRGALWLFVSALCWILGLGSKETAVALPLLILIYEACFHGGWWRERLGSIIGRSGGWRVSIAAAGGVILLVIAVTQLYYAPNLLSWNEPFPARDFNGAQRFYTEARIQFLYLGLLFWPAPSRLNLEHDVPFSLSPFDPWSTAAALAGCLLAVTASIWLARRYPRYGFPLLGYGAFHLLESAPINLELMFEHRMYLPMAFLAMLITNLLVDFVGNRRWPWVGLGLLLIPLAGATYQRNLTWSEPFVFFRDCAVKSPNKFRPWFNLGTQLGRAGHFEEAEEALERAIQLKPGHSMALNQLGNVYLLTRRSQQAFVQYQKAVQAGADNAEALYNLAMMYESRGERQQALHYYRRFIELAPLQMASARQRAEQRIRLLGPKP